MSALTFADVVVERRQDEEVPEVVDGAIGLVVPLEPIVGGLSVQLGRVLGPVGKPGSEHPVAHQQLVFQTQVRICSKGRNKVQPTEKWDA